MKSWRIENYTSLKEVLQEWSNFLREQLVPENTLFHSKLILDELVGNILKHEQGIATVQGRMKDGFICLEICSSTGNTTPEKSFCSDVFSEHGRGLFLVDQFCFSRTYTKDGAVQVLIKIEE